MKGALASEFYSLLENVHKGKKQEIVSPSRFKSILCKLAPQFIGNGQHDAQEFIRFLLDGLHDDLNRIHTEPVHEEFKGIANEAVTVARYVRNCSKCHIKANVSSSNAAMSV